MEYCYKKVDLMRQSYHYQLIDMGRDESVEDFILKIADLGYKDLTPIEVNTMSETQKIEVAVSIINQIQELGEFLFINDSGSIVKPNQSLANWFIAIINKINESLSLGIAAKYKVRKNTYDVQDPIFNIMIPELLPKDRRGMLMKYCEIEDISIDRATLKDISNVLIGFPEQIFFSVKMLKDEGIPFTREHLNEIREFGNDKAATVVETLRQENEDAIDFLAVLSEFELIDYELLNSFITINPNYRGYFDLFLSMSVIEFVGSDREYFRINDVLQDYLSRRRLADKETTEKFLKLITPNIIDENFINNAGLAKYYSSIKTNIEQADDKYIIPSVYLKAIMAAYNEKDYNKVIRIVINRLIESKALDRFDNELITRIYYYLCLSLAREGDTRFYNYIDYNGFEKEDRLFLLGFYNRLNGDPAKAISYLKQALNVRYKYPRAKRELVNAYLLIDDYESAYLYSKDNYYDDKTNPFLIQAYFKSLIHLKSDSSTNEEIKGIVDTALKKPTSPFEKQVKAEISAWNELKFQNNAKEAISIINRAIDDDNDNLYLYLTKIDICEEANNITEMEQAITKLRAIVRSHKRFTNALYIREARLAKAQKRDAEYIRNILAKIKNVPSSVKDRWERQLLS